MQQLNLGDISSLSAQVLAVIRNLLRNEVFTAYLAEVTAFYVENGSARVDVQLINHFKNDKNEILPPKKVLNLLVGMTGGKAWTVSYPIAIGDIGLCVVSKYDLSTFIDTYKSGVTYLSRQFNAADSIFIPLALGLQPEITENLEIKSAEGNTVITITPQGDITINNANNINLTNGKDISISNSGNISVTNQGDLTLTNQGNVTAEVTGKTAIKCDNVEIGGDNLEKMLKAETFMQLFNSHVHTGNLGAPTGTPQIQMSNAQLSTEVKNS